MSVKWRDIYGLYSESWGDRLVPEAMAHPAKVRPAVARAIFEHGISQGYWPKGSTLIDPFAGIGGFLLTGAWAGLRMVGAELEERFVALTRGGECDGKVEGHINPTGNPGQPWSGWFVRHRGTARYWGADMEESNGGPQSDGFASKALAEQAVRRVMNSDEDVWRPESYRAVHFDAEPPSPKWVCTKPALCGQQESHEAHHITGSVEIHRWGDECPRPTMLHGDSRELAKLLGAAAGLATSPPFQGILPGQDEFDRKRATQPDSARFGRESFNGTQAEYGSTPGNLGNLRPGSVEGAVCSPPFGSKDSAGPESLHTRTDATAAKMLKAQGWNGGGQSSPGNLAALPMGDGLATSPPYAESLQNPGGSRTPNAPEGFKLGRSTAGVVSSPPYSESLTQEYRDQDKARAAQERYRQAHPEHAGKRPEHTSYGASPGQLGALKPGSVEGAVSSPPYAAITPGQGGLNTLPPREGSDDQTGRAAGPSQPDVTAYGESPGQLGEMPAGTVDGAVASPPFEGTEGAFAAKKFADPEAFAAEQARRYRSGELKGHPASAEAIRASMERQNGADYGSTAGQLGNERGETFWQAARDIVLQCAQVLKPGAVTAWVCKDFVRNKQRIPFCDDWCRLLEACGFRVFERWRMWQVSRTKQETMWSGAVPQKESKGFFRRLAEAKGSPRIDFEQTIWAVKGANE